MKNCYCGNSMPDILKKCNKCGLHFNTGLPSGKSEPQNTLLSLDIEKLDKIFCGEEDESKHSKR